MRLCVCVCLRKKNTALNRMYRAQGRTSMPGLREEMMEDEEEKERYREAGDTFINPLKTHQTASSLPSHECVCSFCDVPGLAD